ncbi:MAG: AI-2E family transporter [Vulcanimicrobiaceae bacterium]
MTTASLPPRRRRTRSRFERNVTLALKVVTLIVLCALVVGAILGFIGRISSVAIVLIGAIFFAYALFPSVHALARRVGLGPAIAIVYAAIVAIAALAIALIGPALANDAQTLVHSLPGVVHRAQSEIADPTNPLIAHLPPALRTYLATLPPQLVAFGTHYAGQAASGLLGIAFSVVSLVATVVVIPVLAVYLFFEAPGLIAAFVGALPPKARPKTRAILRDLDAVLGGFIRGQFLVGATIGAAIMIMLLIMHVKYAVLIGVAAGLLDIIPYVGAIVAFVPATLLALFNQGWHQALIVAILFVVIFQLEGHFIAPRIVSGTVGLSPLLVIIAILCGAELFGILGMFIAVPVAAALRVLLIHALPNRADSR